VKQVLILADGDWGTESDIAAVKRLASAADHVIAADGALDQAREYGIRVDTVIGDMDSVSDADALDASPEELSVVRFPPEKDWTDLELALDRTLKESPERVIIYGATGGRIDHTMANLALLEKGLATRTAIRLVAGRETVQLTQGHLALDDAAVGDRISLLPVSSSATVTTTGLKYPLAGEALLRAAGRGVSNEVDRLPACIDVHEGIVAVVHARREAEGVG